MTSSRPATILSPILLHSGWYLRSYLIRADSEERIDLEAYATQVSALVVDIENLHMSDEFEYFKVGFVVGHFGRRGICISIWHWGRWTASHELFNQRWYAYGRDLRSLALLDGREPLLSEFEVPILARELDCFREIVRDGYAADGRKRFVECHVQP